MPGFVPVPVIFTTEVDHGTGLGHIESVRVTSFLEGVPTLILTLAFDDFRNVVRIPMRQFVDLASTLDFHWSGVTEEMVTASEVSDVITNALIGEE